MKKMFALVIAAALIMSFSGCNGNDSNEVPDDAGEADAAEAVESASAKKAEITDTSQLPSKFDLRNADGKNYVTPVKAQKWGDCWSFALAGAAETAYLYANGLGVPAGETNDKVNFSEKFIVWYMFHGLTKDDVAKGRVRSPQIDDGFDLSKPDQDNEMTAYYIGGPFIHSANLFGSGFGPVDERAEIKGELPFAYNGEASVGWDLPLNAEYRCAPAAAIFRDSRVLPSPAEYDSNGYRFNQEGINAIKTELYQGHGVTIALNVLEGGFNAKNRAAYCFADEQPNHAVMVVGYDDNFPKENFTKRNATGDDAKKSTPPQNGALIIKNSWGLSSADGDPDDGYIYVSYYDRSLMSALSYVFDESSEGESASLFTDQYDLMMTQWYGSAEYKSETKMANVFEAEESKTLFQLEYRTAKPDSEVTYEIYKNPKKDSPASGALLEKGVNSHKYPGSHKIDLTGEYGIEKGDSYAVVLTVKQGGGFFEVFPYSTEFFEGITVRGVINPGESYLFSDGKWSDMSAIKENILEKAKAQCAEMLASDKALPPISAQAGSVAIDNYPIKAILR